MADEQTLPHKRVVFTTGPIMRDTRQKEESKKEAKYVSGNLQRISQ